MVYIQFEQTVWWGNEEKSPKSDNEIWVLMMDDKDDHSTDDDLNHLSDSDDNKS